MQGFPNEESTRDIFAALKSMRLHFSLWGRKDRGISITFHSPTPPSGPLASAHPITVPRTHALAFHVRPSANSTPQALALRLPAIIDFLKETFPITSLDSRRAPSSTVLLHGTSATPQDWRAARVIMWHDVSISFYLQTMGLVSIPENFPHPMLRDILLLPEEWETVATLKGQVSDLRLLSEI